MSDFLICSSVIKEKSALSFAHFMFNITTPFSVFMQWFLCIWDPNLKCLRHMLLWKNINRGFVYISVSRCWIFFYLHWETFPVAFLQRSVGFRAAHLDIITMDTLFHPQSDWKNTLRLNSMTRIYFF